MKGIALAVCLWLSVFSAAVQAQTKYSGTLRCGKAEKGYKIELGDQSNHAFVLNQVLCEHFKPGEIAGINFKQTVSSGTAEITGNTSRWQGFNVDTMANGDKIFARLQCTFSLNADGTTKNGECEFTQTGGTGKFAGIKGEGTAKGTAVGDGSVNWEYDGQYVLK